MAVSKRLRMEVFRRDNHACRYCGAAAPEVKITIDHVNPVALGGSDEPANLVTACVDCNAGKSSIIPGAPLVEDVKSDALRWANAMQRAIEERVCREGVLRDEVGYFDEVWSNWTYNSGGEALPIPRDHDWESSIRRWVLMGINAMDLEDLVGSAMQAPVPVSAKWKCFCKKAWAVARADQEAALAILDREQQDAPCRCLDSV